MDNSFSMVPLEPDPAIQDKIDHITKQVSGNELKILDEFSKAFLASEMITGKDLIGVLKEYELQIKTDYSCSSFTTTYSYKKISESN